MVFDILDAQGFKNLVWLDGGADGGKDITAVSIETDASGYTAEKEWRVDAKKYANGVPFEKIHPALTKATTSNSSYMLFVIWPHLTPQCKAELDNWAACNHAKFSIRVWEKKDIESRLIKHPDILRKYLPEVWNKNLEMDVYFKEATQVIGGFLGRVGILWKTPESQPWSDLLLDLIVPKDKNKSLFIEDKSHQLTNGERIFLCSLLELQRQINNLLIKTFNAPAGTVFKISRWDKYPDDFLVFPIFEKDILTKNKLKKAEELLGNLRKNRSEHEARGIVATSYMWKPYNEKNRLYIYLIVPKKNS